jgi:hypothetical protein
MSSESLRPLHLKINEYDLDDISSDGFIRTCENTLGKHLANFDADHFELFGLRPRYNPDNIVEVIANNIKFHDEEENKLIGL